MSYYRVNDEEKSRLPAWVCAEDAKRRDAENIDSFTPEQIAEGARLREMVHAAYFRSRVFRNYREGFIAVKVESPTIADKISPAVGKLDEYCAQNGIKIKKMRSAIIYTIAKK